MQVVVVKVRGVCNPGLGLTTFGLVACAKAGPDAAISATAKNVVKIFMVASPLPTSSADAIPIAAKGILPTSC
jgi:hypothetical protein